MQAKQPQEQAHSRATPLYKGLLALLETATRRIAHGGGDGCGLFHNTIRISLDIGTLNSYTYLKTCF